MRQIKVTKELHEQLQRLYKVKYCYVQQVLTYRRNGGLAEKIRRTAIRLGGRYMDPDFVPTCTTQYVDGMIIQRFGEQVILRIAKATGNITLEHQGKVVDKVDNASMDIWNSMAIKAQDIAETAMAAR